MVSKVTWKLRLDSFIDTKKHSKEEKDKLKEEIGEYLVDKMLEDISLTKSPVDNSKFPRLSEDYKKFKEKSRRGGSANLEFMGDMLDALKHEPYTAGVEVGVFDFAEAQKADNHNKFSGKSKRTGVPKRQFVPKKKQTFRKEIMDGVAKIAKEVLDDA